MFEQSPTGGALPAPGGEVPDAAALAEVSEEVKRILAAHPLYPEYDF